MSDFFKSHFWTLVLGEGTDTLFWASSDIYTVFQRNDGLSGLPQHRKNEEFGSPFFQSRKTQGICQKYLKKFLHREFATNTDNLEIKIMSL